ncbi:MAG: response regulator [Candidatus Taylorbacteria bacterium]|nr:response regulator [Candidatus Taylorbacteria bacterium]
MPESKNKKVLIIDDDRFLLNMYSVKFHKSGFEVDTAISGQEALTKLREGASADIVLLDLVMPAMDGLELLANIRKEKLIPRAVVVVLSNQNQPADIERAKSLGIASYIVKASSIPSEVVEEVIKVVGKSAGRKL